jgi:chemotaxis protein MotA
MLQLAGLVLVIAIIAGALFVSGGQAILSALPFELALIGGAAVATLMIGNAPKVAKAAVLGMGRAMRGAKWSRRDYQSLLVTLHELSRRARRGGIVAIEQDIEAPDDSALFQQNPALLNDPEATNLICDGFRMMAMDPAAQSRLRVQLEEQVASMVEERQRAANALHTLADALPALGIVAAVLGIIKTMGFIDSEPAILGDMIAAALLGTFLGVFLAYGIVGPIAARLTQVIEEEALYLDAIRDVLSGHAEGLAPRVSLELARNRLPHHLRPIISELDTSLTEARFAARRAA